LESLSAYICRVDDSLEAYGKNGLTAAGSRAKLNLTEVLPATETSIGQGVATCGCTDSLVAWLSLFHF
jgi:hypothetical protein